jgi:glycine hydroxymethyltransferase
MFKRSDSLEKLDPAIWEQIVNENKRQEEHIELIASENYTLPAVMEAQGSQLTNKYAEGYIGKRFYGGCEYIDEVERIAIDRLKELYGAEYANVQPHSGSQANQAVYFSMLKPGDTIMGMNLGHGGHLTHGSPANLSGKLFNIVPYGLNEQEEIDYDEMERLAIESKPKLIIGGASAYSLKFDWERMSQIAKKVGALFMVDVAHYSGLVAGGAYPNPMPYADFVTSTTHKSLRGPRGGFILAKPEYEKIINSYQKQVVKNAQSMVGALQDRGYRIVSGRTESHVFLIDLIPKNLTGKRADIVLGQAQITVNKNSIPNDPESPFVTSGIRIGSPAITSRGFMEKEAALVGNFIADVLDDPDNVDNIKGVKSRVSELTKKFPVYGN